MPPRAVVADAVAEVFAAADRLFGRHDGRARAAFDAHRYGAAITHVDAAGDHAEGCLAAFFFDRDRAGHEVVLVLLVAVAVAFVGLVFPDLLRLRGAGCAAALPPAGARKTSAVPIGAPVPRSTALAGTLTMTACRPAALAGTSTLKLPSDGVAAEVGLPASQTRLSFRSYGHDPYAYLENVLARLPPQRDSQIGALLPATPARRLLAGL